VTIAHWIAGTWIGATREDHVMHVWRIVQRGENAFVYATLDDHGAENYYSARVMPGAMLINGNPHAQALLVDAGHFILPRWHDGHDMLFSREGLAELSALSTWERYDSCMARRES
jgi:hypothetical protein